MLKKCMYIVYTQTHIVVQVCPMQFREQKKYAVIFIACKSHSMVVYIRIAMMFVLSPYIFFFCKAMMIILYRLKTVCRQRYQEGEGLLLVYRPHLPMMAS